MARFGQGFIQALTNPSYQQGLFTAAQSVGAAPGVAAAEQKQKEQESELMNYVSALSQKTMPPAGMAAQRESLLNSGISLEKILAAENLGAKQRDQGIARLEAGQVSINAQAKEARRKQLEMNAVNKATTLGRPNDAAALAGADEATLRSYLMQRPEAEYDISEQTIIQDGVPTVVQVATNKKNPTDRIITPIGQATPKEANKSLLNSFSEAGLEVDLSTIEGLKKAREFALSNLNNASLANTLTGMIEEKLPIQTSDAIKLMREVNPAIVKDEEALEVVGRFKSLNELAADDIAGLRALIERTVTATTENDLRAVAELERFRGSSSLDQRLKDWALGLTVGTLSKETREEYNQIMTGLQKLAENRISNSIDNFILTANTQKERQAAETARDYLTGSFEGARILD